MKLSIYKILLCLYSTNRSKCNERQVTLHLFVFSKNKHLFQSSTVDIVKKYLAFLVIFLHNKRQNGIYIYIF